MIIGIDASRANGEQRTGVEEYAFRVITEMYNREQGIGTTEEIEFVLYTDKPLQGELVELPENWTQKVLAWWPKRLWTQIRLSWEMFRNPPDVLFIPAHVMPLIHPKKTVAVIHDTAAIKFPESYNWFERWYSVWSARYALKRAWKVIVPSKFVKEELQNADLRIQNNDKVFVVQHGYDEKYKKIEDEKGIEKVLKKYSIQKPFIMSVGRLEEKKNTTRIIQAFNKLKTTLGSETENLKLLLVGKPGYGYGEVRHTLSNSVFKHDIVTPGWVDEQDLPYLLNAAEVFVFPSLYEGFGLPVLESMACGTPVVASKGNSLEEVGGDACVYVDPMSVEDIARGVSEAMQNAECRMQNVNRGLERVKDFSWEKCARETLEILMD
ncbi:MAG: glycosyltransferase family 1 protein [Candidatus Magasanikbacteria bacterium]